MVVGESARLLERCEVLGGRSCDELHAQRPEHLGITVAASVEDICRRITPYFLHTIPAQGVTQFIVGATVPKRLVGKQAIPHEEWASGPSSSSAGPEVRAEPPEPCDHPRMSPETIPVADVELEIETWRRLTSAEQEYWENLKTQKRVMHVCTDLTQNWDTPTSGEWLTA